MSLHDRIPPRVRLYLDSWRFWFTVLAIGGLIGLWFVSSSAVKREAAAEAAYDRCVESIPTIRRANRFFRGTNSFVRIAVMNSRDLLEQTDPTDPELPQRQENYLRLLEASRDVTALRELPVPTQELCEQRRREALS